MTQECHQRNSSDDVSQQRRNQNMNQWDFPGRSVSQPAQNLQGIIEQLAENVHPF